MVDRRENEQGEAWFTGVRRTLKETLVEREHRTEVLGEDVEAHDQLAIVGNVRHGPQWQRVREFVVILSGHDVLLLVEQFDFVVEFPQRRRLEVIGLLLWENIVGEKKNAADRLARDWHFRFSGVRGERVGVRRRLNLMFDHAEVLPGDGTPAKETVDCRGDLLVFVGAYFEDQLARHMMRVRHHHLEANSHGDALRSATTKEAMFLRDGSAVFT